MENVYLKELGIENEKYDGITDRIKAAQRKLGVFCAIVIDLQELNCIGVFLSKIIDHSILFDAKPYSSFNLFILKLFVGKKLIHSSKRKLLYL